MTETIYGDVLFLINFSMDFLSIYITGKIMKIRAKAWRYILSASLGGIYGVATLFTELDGTVLTLANVACAFVMCFIAFFGGKIRRVLLSSAVFYGTGMLLGGVMTLIYSKLGKYTGYVSIGGSIATVFGEIPLWLFAVLACVSALITMALGRIFKSRREISSAIVKIRFGEKASEVECLVDSGNLLRDPISGTPVIFLSENTLKIIPAELLSAIKNGGTTYDIGLMRRIRFLPTSAIGGTGMTVCVMPDECLVGGEERKALVAIDFQKTDFGGYGGLVPRSLI